MHIQNMAGAALQYLHHEGRLCCSRHLHDKIEQLPQYSECALSNSRHILNAHEATFGSSMMSLEQEKKWAKLAIGAKDSCWCCSWSILNAHRADLNMHRASLSVLKIKNVRTAKINVKLK